MNKLWARIALAFLLITALSVSAVALVANNQVGAQFARYLSQSRVEESGLLEQMQNVYAAQGNWQGAEAILTSAAPGRGRGAGGGGRQEVILAEPDGRIVAATSGRAGALTEAERDMAVPISSNGKVVGLLASITPANTQVANAAAQFVSRINQTLAQAAVMAALAGAALGFIIARGMAKPLGDLAQAARRVAQGRLDERVRVGGADELIEVSSAFNEMVSQLQISEDLRRNMVADIAHELRTPLTVLQGNLQAILDDVYPLSKTEIATIYDETLILRRLVNDLRELSLAEAGQLTLNMTAAPVGPQAHGAGQRFRELFEAKGVVLEVAVADDAPVAHFDPDRAAQALNNLLSNALRHTPAGGRVTVRVTRAGAYARVSVSDTGAGISPADLPHVFDRFWRSDKSRARDSSGGSGLGLAIARQFAQAMGGQMGAESTLGKGSEFWFTLPV